MQRSLSLRFFAFLITLILGVSVGLVRRIYVERQEVFISAAFMGQRSQMKAAYAMGIDVNAATCDFRSCFNAVWAAAYGGYDDEIQFLVERGADVNARPAKSRSTALMVASYKGNESTVRLLLRLGSDPNATVEGETALTFAKQKGHFEIVQLLRQAGALERPAVEAKVCTPAPRNELPKDRFARKGGRETKVVVRRDKDLLTVDGIEQGRDLSLYERVDLGGVRNESASALADARLFLWEHWSSRKAGYLTLTLSSVDATSTSHIFIERDEKGRWRVAWRIVRHNGRIHDLPTYYAVDWVRPGGWREPGLPLGVGEQPDPTKHQLEFRDKCGDIEQSL